MNRKKNDIVYIGHRKINYFQMFLALCGTVFLSGFLLQAVLHNITNYGFDGITLLFCTGFLVFYYSLRDLYFHAFKRIPYFEVRGDYIYFKSSLFGKEVFYWKDLQLIDLNATIQVPAIIGKMKKKSIALFFKQRRKDILTENSYDDLDILIEFLKSNFNDKLNE